MLNKLIFILTILWLCFTCENVYTRQVLWIEIYKTEQIQIVLYIGSYRSCHFILHFMKQVLRNNIMPAFSILLSDTDPPLERLFNLFLACWVLGYIRLVLQCIYDNDYVTLKTLLVMWYIVIFHPYLFVLFYHATFISHNCAYCI